MRADKEGSNGGILHGPPVVPAPGELRMCSDCLGAGTVKVPGTKHGLKMCNPCEGEGVRR